MWNESIDWYVVDRRCYLFRSYWGLIAFYRWDHYRPERGHSGWNYGCEGAD